jgi:ribosomal protein L35
MPMDHIFEWAEKQTKRFKVTKEGKLVKKLS